MWPTKTQIHILFPRQHHGVLLALQEMVFFGATVWGGRLRKRFCNMFSESSTGNWAELQLPCCTSKKGELPENILQHLLHNLPPQTIRTATARCTPLQLAPRKRAISEAVACPGMFRDVLLILPAIGRAEWADAPDSHNTPEGFYKQKIRSLK